MDQATLERILRQAADAAKVVPEDLRTAAFESAVRLLSAADGQIVPERTSRLSRRTNASKTQSVTASPKRSKTDDDADRLMALDRTQYPELTHELATLRRSLRVLQIARDDLGITHLTSIQIANLLTRKFLIRTDRSTVGKALAGANALVDRVARGKGYAYQLMGAGDTFLAAPKDPTEANPKAPTPGTRRRRAGKPAARGSASRNESQTVSAPPNSRTRTPSRGPTPALAALVGERFFAVPRTIHAIQTHLETKKGLRYKVTDLSSVLTRLTRSGTLDRDKNATGQYEYKTPGA